MNKIFISIHNLISKHSKYVKLINLTKDLADPTYSTDGSGCVDLRANINSTLVLNPNNRVLIPSGIKVQMPYYMKCEIKPRSGLSRDSGIVVGGGYIDSDYTGEIGVILINTSNTPFTIKRGDRIAQLEFGKYIRANFYNAPFKNTKRGDNGFGHTGTK